ncbi:MAG: DUF2029 domain-containing protein [Ardenticatenaceae bacterium]|nr:DUF2029 domain-containing protein [Ardenticatenaceae bacterium]
MHPRSTRETMTPLPTLLFFVLALVAVLGYGGLLRLTFTSYYRGANDFFIPWRAVQLLLTEGRNPYGPDVTADIQRALFGHTRQPDEHQFDFAYPLILAPLLAPYTLLPYEWAQPLWQATIQTLLAAGLLLWYRTLHPARVAGRGTAVGTATLLLWGLTLYPAARAFLLGQIALLVFAAAVVALWALARGRDGTAGAALALVTVKPQLSFLAVPALLVLAWTSGRRQVLWGFGATFVGLLALSLALMPGWPLAFFQRLVEYQRYTSLGAASDSPSPLALLVRPFGSAAAAVEALGVVALLAVLFDALWRQRLAPAWPQVGNALLTVSAWIAPRAATTDQVLLLLPLLFLLRRRPRPVAMVVAGLVWAGLWLLFFTTVQGDQEQLIVRLPLPLIVLALWLSDRRMPSSSLG